MRKLLTIAAFTTLSFLLAGVLSLYFLVRFSVRAGRTDLHTVAHIYPNFTVQQHSFRTPDFVPFSLCRASDCCLLQSTAKGVRMRAVIKPKSRAVAVPNGPSCYCLKFTS